MTQLPIKTSHFKVQNLALSRGEKPLFSGLSFEIGSGDIIWVGGENGAGKTSLLKCIAGLIRPDRGTVEWTSPETKIAYQGHKDSHKRNLTALENLEFWSKVTKSTLSPMDALEKTKLTSNSMRLAKQLSAGQARRLSLARMLLQRADVWIMDEPLASLDQNGRDLVKHLLQVHLGSGGSAILASHGSPFDIGLNARVLNFHPSHEIEAGHERRH